MASIATMPAKEMRPPERLAVATLEQPERRPQPGMANIEQHAEWPLLSRLPMHVSAEIPLRHFRVKDLLALQAGQVIASAWRSSEDVPLKLGAVHLYWSEFEMVEQRMAVRLTRLA